MLQIQPVADDVGEQAWFENGGGRQLSVSHRQRRWTKRSPSKARNLSIPHGQPFASDRGDCQKARKGCSEQSLAFAGVVCFLGIRWSEYGALQHSLQGI